MLGCLGNFNVCKLYRYFQQNSTKTKFLTLKFFCHMFEWDFPLKLPKARKHELWTIFYLKIRNSRALRRFFMKYFLRKKALIILWQLHVSLMKEKYGLELIFYFFLFFLLSLKNSKKKKVDFSYHGNKIQNGWPKSGSSY